MSEVINARIEDSVRGGRIQFGTFTLDPSAIGDGAVGAESVDIAGIEAGDQIIVQPRTLTTDLVCTGALAGAGSITVYLSNTSGAEVNGAEVTYDYILLKL